MAGTKTINEAFLAACQNGEESKVYAAIELGVDINTKNRKGQTGLLFAIWKKHEHIVDILLAREDIDINAKSNNGSFPLWAAAGNGLSSVVAKLGRMPGLRRDNDQGGDGGWTFTPLSLATHFGKDNNLLLSVNFMREIFFTLSKRTSYIILLFNPRIVKK